jgi:hypothetical protein
MATRSVVFLAYTEHFLVGSLVFGQSLAATPCSKPTIQHMTTNGGFGARAATQTLSLVFYLHRAFSVQFSQFSAGTGRFPAGSVDFWLT